MPATAGRVKMPANNRVSSSSALQTHSAWQNIIGYDPYAPEKDNAAASSDAPNPMEQFKNLMDIAKKSQTTTVSGACKKCGQLGHLAFQCRNHLKGRIDADEVSSTSSEESDLSSLDSDLPKEKKRKRESSEKKKSKKHKKEKAKKEKLKSKDKEKKHKEKEKKHKSKKHKRSRHE
eukprot:Rmarinus@m.20782